MCFMSLMFFVDFDKPGAFVREHRACLVRGRAIAANADRGEYVYKVRCAPTPTPTQEQLCFRDAVMKYSWGVN